MTTATLPAATVMYRALLEKDASFEGIFMVGVKTTGVFCRPTCGAKKPLARNVEYFASARDALRAGYRPCQRCKPMDAATQRPEWVSALLERVETDPTRRLCDGDLRAMGVEPARARAYFSRHYGMTFHAYHRARRVGLALNEIRRGTGLLESGRRAGFESDSGFRDAFARLFGAPPGRGRDLAPPLLAAWLDTPLGPMLAVANDEGLCLLEFVDRRMIETQIPVLRRAMGGAAIVPGRNAHLNRIQRELGRYFAGELRRFTTPLVLRGGEFQMRVWHRLLEIPYGETLSYGRMARDIGFHGAARAVGRANGDNRLAIVVPCHRVVRSDGTLCGYGGGLWRKQRLLELEGATGIVGRE